MTDAEILDFRAAHSVLDVPFSSSKSRTLYTISSHSHPLVQDRHTARSATAALGTMVTRARDLDLNGLLFVFRVGMLEVEDWSEIVREKDCDRFCCLPKDFIA